MRSRALVSCFCTCVMGLGVACAAERRDVIADYAGQWVNVERNTRYITRIEIVPQTSGVDGAAQMHIWGKCLPRDCDWGSSVAGLRKGRLSVVWKQQFGVIKHEATIEPDGRLRLASESRFADRAGRQAQRSVTYFVKEPVTP